jgi:hypothetical protein
MVTLSFDDVTLTMSTYDWDRLRKFLSVAIEVVPVEYVAEHERLLDEIGVGYATHTRLYKEKIVDESR